MARLRRFLSEAPLFFLAVVLGVALTFRIAIGAVKPKGPATASETSSVPASPDTPRKSPRPRP